MGAAHQSSPSKLGSWGSRKIKAIDAAQRRSRRLRRRRRAVLKAAASSRRQKENNNTVAHDDDAEPEKRVVRKRVGLSGRKVDFDLKVKVWPSPGTPGTPLSSGRTRIATSGASAKLRTQARKLAKGASGSSLSFAEVEPSGSVAVARRAAPAVDLFAFAARSDLPGLKKSVGLYGRRVL